MSLTWSDSSGQTNGPKIAQALTLNNLSPTYSFGRGRLIFYVFPSSAAMFESPFYKRKCEFKKEDTSLQAKWSSALKRFEELFVEAIPSDDVKQLPISYIHPVGFMIFIVLLGIFAGVFVPGFYVQLRTKFLAPVDSGNSKYCEPVVISNTGTFLAAREGIWEGDPNFVFANGSYQLSATNYQTLPEAFAEDMTTIYRDLQFIGKYAETVNLGVNLLIWSSWTEVKSNYNAQRFGMSGTPLAILNRAITVGTVSNVYSDCDAIGTSSFNPNSGIMQVSYNVQDFVANPNCTNTTKPENFGYRSNLHTDSFNIRFDVRTIFTCVALNSQIAGIQNMIQIQSLVAPFQGQNYTGGQFVDPQFPGMKPVFCLFSGNTTYRPLCTVIVGNVYTVPLFNHAGYSFDMPEMCNCTEQLKGDVATNQYNLCNIFNFLTGFLFYPEADFKPEAILNLLFKYYTKDDVRSLGRTLNELAFAPMFTAGIYGQISPNRSVISSPAYREAMYAFCHDEEFGPCSIVTFNSIDESQQSTDWVVSDNFFQLTLGACSDSFSTTWEAWSKLINQPFAPLTQQYQTCRNNPTTVFFNQLGVSAGNVSLQAPAGVLFVMLLLALYQLFTGASIPRGYSRTEKDAALDALALAMLLVRDKRPQLEAILTQCDTENTKESGKSARTTAASDGSVKNGKVAENSLSSSLADNNNCGGATTNGAQSAMLLQLVDQLATLAAVAENNQALYHQTESEPVHINWKELSRRLAGGKGNKTNVNRSGSGFDNRRTDSLADVELATVSELHSHNTNE